MVAGQPLDDPPGAGIDEGEEAVEAADNEQAAVRHVSHAADRSGRDDAKARERPQRAGVEQGDAAVGPSDGEDAAVGPEGVAREFRAVPSDLERPAEPAIAGEIPGEDLAVQAGGVERRAVAGDRDSGDLPGVAFERLDGGRLLGVPDDRATVLAGGDRVSAVGAEGGPHHRAGVASGRGA